MSNPVLLVNPQRHVTRRSLGRWLGRIADAIKAVRLEERALMFKELHERDAIIERLQMQVEHGAAIADAMRDLFTENGTEINILGSFFSMGQRLLFGEAIADSGPLAALIERYVDSELLRRVAEAHDRGRRLYVATVDLDSLRLVVWNMGLIAKSGRPEALVLFRKVMLASASIPIVFPPVFFEVEVDGQRYDEMHVDGAVGARVFYNEGLFSPEVIRDRGRQGGPEGREDIFVIHNGQLFPVPRPALRNVLGISTRVLDATGRSAVIGDLFRIHSIARSADASMLWVTIPDGVQMTGDEVFDPVVMTALFEVGYRRAVAAGSWATVPPGMQSAPGRSP